MPIIRTYGCEGCGNFMDVTLTMDQVDDPPPECPHCAGKTYQQFKPFAIGGTPASKAHALAEDIMANDYHVADTSFDKYNGRKVRYKDETPKTEPDRRSTFQAAGADLAAAMQMGKKNRLSHGDPLAVLQHNIKTGKERDLIADSIQRSKQHRVW